MATEPLLTPRTATAARPKSGLVLWAPWVIGAAVLAVYPLVFTLPFPRHLAIMVLLYAALGQAWNILSGSAGQISLGHAIFFGIGAYTSATLQLKAGLTPLLGMWAGVGLALAMALTIGPVLFRMSGHHFVIATLAIVEVAMTVAGAWEYIGANGGLTLPMLSPGLVHFQWISKLPYYAIAIGLALLAHATAWYLERSRAGYYFRAIKANPSAARALGVSLPRYKTLALLVSAGLTSLGGSFYAHYVLYLDPPSLFSFRLSVMIALVAVLGGVGSFWGPLLGALVLVPLSEFTRIWLSGSGRAIDLIVYGLLIVLIALYQPGGLWAMIERRLRRWR